MSGAGEPCPYLCESGVLPALGPRAGEGGNGRGNAGAGASAGPGAAGSPGPAGSAGLAGMPGAATRCPACGGKVRRCARCGAGNRLLGRFCRRCREPLAPWAYWTGPRVSASGCLPRGAPWATADVRSEARWASDQLPEGLSAPRLAAGSGALYALGGDGELACVDVVTGREVDRVRPGPEPIGVAFNPGRSDTEDVVAVLGATRMVGYFHHRRGPEEAGSPIATPLSEMMSGYPPSGFTAFTRGPVFCGDHVVCALTATRAFGIYVFDAVRRCQAPEASQVRSFGGRLAVLTCAGPGRILVGSEEGSLMLLSIPDCHTIARWDVVRGLRGLPALAPCVLDDEALILDSSGRLMRCRLVEGSDLTAVGQVEVPEASALVTGPEEISVGDQKGRLWRFTAGGLDGASWEPKLPSEAAPSPINVSPIAFADGCALAPGGAGTAVALLPRPRMARAEISFSFPHGGPLSALLWLDGIVVGATARGEVSVLEMTVKEPGQ